jgi:hypothetical protein
MLVSISFDFCYIVHHNAIAASDLNKLKDALDQFHHYHMFFIGTTGVKGEFILLPCQHSLLHYTQTICLFGSLNGLCSITESNHIKAIEEPWQHSSCFKALVEMLQTISQLKKLAAA